MTASRLFRSLPRVTSTRWFKALTLALGALSIVHAHAEPLLPQAMQAYDSDLLARVRQASSTIPGARAIGINYVKFAESRRQQADVIEGGAPTEFVSARTAFQVVFPYSTVMIDAGMDLEVHKTFGTGREEPYWPERNALLQQALRQSSLILLTHEHGDHVAGVIRSDARKELAAKTLLTRDQASTLILSPQIPEIRLTRAAARDYLVIDYETLLPVAPGIVLIKAPGHTPGHQMVYVQLSSGREFLFIGDIGWTLDNVVQQKLRPARTMRRIGEDAGALTLELGWIKEMMDKERLIVIPSHDDVLLRKLGEGKVIGEQLYLR